MKKISVMTPCYNEEGNVYNMYMAVKKIFKGLPGYRYEHIFADNCSQDNTESILRNIAAEDKNVKVILNARNFGPTRSGGNALLRATGDAVISMACDFQDPPDLIVEFLKEWENGYKIVLGQKTKSKENKIKRLARNLYYKIMKHLADSEHLENVTGFGLYDKEVIDTFRWMADPYPYYRGIICDLGYSRKLIQYTQQKRASGKSSYNFFRYLDEAITGLTNSSKAPLRIASMLGIIFSIIAFFMAVTYFIMKLIYWDRFSFGMAPILISIFFFSSLQLAFTGIIGEYIGVILTKVTKRPLVIEKEKLNFNEKKNAK